jgi:hypothetical protein
MTGRLTDSDLLLGGMLLAAPFYLLVVGGPSALVVAAAEHRRVAAAGVVVMSVVAVSAGVTMAASDDAQAGLAVLLVPMVGLPMALAVWVGESVAARRAADRGTPRDRVLVPADLRTRLCAFAIDVVATGLVLYVPVTVLSHAHREVAAAGFGLAAAALLLGLPVARTGHTFGQGILGLCTVDAATGGPVPLARAVGRSLVVAVEMAGVFTFVLALPALFDVVSVSANGRSIGDRLFRTAVLARR